jgi:hypothetical protein
MPIGTGIDELLPIQVGPYKHESLRPAMGRPLANAIEEGVPIYAEYRAGDAEVFVELGVTSSVEVARQSLEVAAGEVGDKFPTDQRFGARNQEPSYLKVINSDGAFFAWTRGRYYFSAFTNKSEAALDLFMKAFPY